jgi:hypothetical protein
MKVKKSGSSSEDVDIIQEYIDDINEKIDKQM